MTVSQALAAAAYYVYAVLAVCAFGTYLRRRDPVPGLVGVMFLPAVVYVAADAGRAGGWPHWRVLACAGALLFLGRATVLLLLADRLRPVPRALLGASVASWAALAIPVATLPRPYPPLVSLGYILTLLLPQAGAAVVFVAEARQRRGMSAGRLAAAAGASVAGIANMVTAAAGTAAGLLVDGGTYALVPTSAGGHVVLAVQQTLLLLSAVGYAVAFVPPRWLRRVWAATVAQVVSDRILAGPPDERPEQVWHRYVAAVREVTGSEAVAAWSAGRPDGLLLPLAQVGAPIPGLAGGAAAWAELRAAARAHRRVLHVVPLHGPGVAGGALAVLARRHSLFAADELEVLAGMARHAAVLAQRSASLERQRALTDELAGSVRALTVAGAARERFFATVSHELRTPLNAIIGFSDLLRGHLPPGQEEAQWLEHVHHSGQRLLRAVNSLLDVAACEAGRLEVRPAPVAPLELLAEAVRELEPQVARHGLAVEVGGDDGWTWLDPRLIRQVVDNLLANAVNFTPAGGRITARAAVGRDEVTIVVADTGCGIAPADQERVFDEFAQVKTAQGRVRGTGLGLAVVRRVVAAHGGRVTLRSAPGVGSEFTVALPPGRLPRGAGRGATQ